MEIRINKRTINKVMASVYPNWLSPTFYVINTLRGVLWKPISQHELSEHYSVSRHDSPFRNFPITVDSPVVSASFKVLNVAAQREYFLTYPGELIHEPKYGWAMTRSGRLLMDSLPYTYYALLPGLYDYLKARIIGSDVITTHALASLRDVGDKNYYHFYNDHLVKLAMLHRMGVGTDVPLLVSKVLFSKPYFQEALERSTLKKHSWIVQDREYVVSKKSFFIKTMPITKEYLEYVLALLKPPKANVNKQRRIFIDRDKSVGRCITNIDEIREMLSCLGFEIVNLAGKSLASQMELFSEAGMVIGIHGAGLSNIIFRAGAAMKVIEIFPPNNIPAMFYWLSSRLGFDYDAVVGEKRDWKRADRQQYAKIDFYVDPEKLKKLCLTMAGK